MPYGSLLDFFFVGFNNAAAKVTVVVQTDDDTVLVSCGFS